MANIRETNHWEEAIYEIATTDDVIGGADGISNRQATQLAARSNFLKAQINDLETGKKAAGKALQFATKRVIQLQGDAAGSAHFDGSANADITLTLHDSGVQAGNYRQVTVDSKGRVTQGSNPTTLAAYGITDDVALESWVLGLNYKAAIEDATRLAQSAQASANYANLPKGTCLPFAQAAAPTGWTQVNTDATHNRLLRVVNGDGGRIGGLHDPVINNVVPAHTHWFTTGNNSADHSHVIHDPGHYHTTLPFLGDGNRAYSGGGASNFGSGGNGFPTTPATTGVWNSGATSVHTHSGSTDNGSSQTNWQPRYIDLIICVKD